MTRSFIILASFVALGLARPAAAIEAPYEQSLLRLAEVLGSLHYLRNLCGETGDTWRNEMEKLLTTEKPDEARKARLVASFNRGYRSFETSYASCTASAIESIRRYMKEGETLSRDVAVRYGN